MFLFTVTSASQPQARQRLLVIVYHLLVAFVPCTVWLAPRQHHHGHRIAVKDGLGG